MIKKLLWEPVIREPDYTWQSADGKVNIKIENMGTAWVWYIYKDGFLIDAGRKNDSDAAKERAETRLFLHDLMDKYETELDYYRSTLDNLSSREYQTLYKNKWIPPENKWIPPEDK